jgi:hypothetical protein
MTRLAFLALVLGVLALARPTEAQVTVGLCEDFLQCLPSCPKGQGDTVCIALCREAVGLSKAEAATCLAGTTCGNVRCPPTTTCCNASCGICVEPGGFCTQQVCSDTSVRQSH